MPLLLTTSLLFYLSKIVPAAPFAQPLLIWDWFVDTPPAAL